MKDRSSLDPTHTEREGLKDKEVTLILIYPVHDVCWYIPLHIFHHPFKFHENFMFFHERAEKGAKLLNKVFPSFLSFRVLW
jgi:hypothetical protein